MIKLTIWTKKRKTENGKEFITYTTRTKDGRFVSVRETQETKKPLPKDKKIFVLNVEPNMITNPKMYKTFDKNLIEGYTNYKMYILDYVSIEEFVNEPVDEDIF